jgi:hypothetical protein
LISNATKLVKPNEKPKQNPLNSPLYNIIYDLTTLFKENPPSGKKYPDGGLMM